MTGAPTRVASATRPHLVDAAVASWHAVSGRTVDASSVVPLKEKKASVYLLPNAGPGGADVVAKHGARRQLATDVIVYRRVAPRVPVRMLELYGVADDGDDDVWLFLERAGSEHLSSSPSDRAALGRFLAALHLATAELDVGLPEHVLDRYVVHLHAARTAIAESSGNPFLDDHQHDVLAGVDGLLARTEDEWAFVEAACGGAPRVLVHGDLVAKNVHLWRHDGDPALTPLDWETGGIGVAAADLSSFELASLCARPDLDEYLREASVIYPGWDRARLATLAGAGTVLRAVAAMAWVSRRLQYEWVARPLRDLPVFAGALGHAMAGLRRAGRGVA